jgi:hypothetical protein
MRGKSISDVYVSSVFRAIVPCPRSPSAPVADDGALDEAMAEGGPNIPWESVKVDLGWV